MPPFEEMDLQQPAVWWVRVGEDENGEPVFEEPVEIEVRWTWGESTAPSPQGGTAPTSAQVVTADEVSAGDLLWDGTLDDWYGTGSGAVDAGLMEVVSANYTPDLKGRTWRTELGLGYWKGTVPPLHG